MDAVILKAAAAGAKQFTLDNKKLNAVPASIGRLGILQSLSMKSNNLTSLPEELGLLRHLVSLNVGNNHLVRLDRSLSCLWKLESLHLYQNNISEVDAQVVCSLIRLKLLNLNHNRLTTIPSEVRHLRCLTHLSLANNHIVELPDEIGELAALVEFNVEGNSMERLPYTVGRLSKMKKCFLQKNRLKRLPKSIKGCASLSVLDVSCNSLEMFPLQLLQLPLSELHYESNPFIPFIPVPSELLQEVLALKELASRALLVNLCSEYMGAGTSMAPKWLADFAQSSGVCAACKGPFVDSWLECIKFVDIKQSVPSLKTVSSEPVPFHAPLCSYTCFDATAHEREYYGLAGD